VEVDVGVVLLAYNQDKFIEQSINSVLNQKFKGNFKLYIFDDHSTDSSFDICLRFQSMFPDKMVLFRSKVNIGLAKNFEKAIIETKSKYIAYLEGDDYWTDNYKLQKQFNFLEENPNFVLAFHDFVIVDENNTIISDKNIYNKFIQKNRSKRDLVTGCLIHQNTMMFRNVVRKFPLGFFLAKNHDTFFLAYLSTWGEAGYVACRPLHYRIHTNSLWSSLSGKRKHLNGLITYFVILFYIPYRFYGSVIRVMGSKLRSILIS
jgi:glycosyltransferase involved in cell wall biosynthesis